MRKLLKIGFYLIMVATVASCTKDNPASFTMEKPDSIMIQDSLNSEYEILKAYVDTVGSEFKLGASISASDYADQEAIYSLVNSNFQEVTAHDLGHGTVVQADGSLVMVDMMDFLDSAHGAGITVYGNALLTPENQNEAYLNELIAPEEIEVDEGGWGILTSADFESDDASNYESNEAAITSFTAEGEGADGEGRALQVENEVVRENDWESQLFMTLGTNVEEGDQLRFVVDVRADEDVSFPTQAHGEPGAYLHWDFFGTISAGPEWSEHVMEITVSEEQAGAGTIAFNLGATATTYYFDNMEVWYYDTEGGTELVEKTPEEKEEILSTELENWVSSMLEDVTSINTWDVVYGAIAGGDEDSYELSSDAGFSWSEYLGDDYGVQAFQVAREHAGEDDILFISDYGLENLGKAHGIVNYVNYIEDNGATVDGIGTHLNISINTSEQNITDMFEILAASGKLVKISGLSIGLGGIGAGSASSEVYQAQSDMYQFVVEEYFNIIPEDQRYGITISDPIDSSDNPAGLWTNDYERKRAYAGFATGIMNGFNSGN